MRDERSAEVISLWLLCDKCQKGQEFIGPKRVATGSEFLSVYAMAYEAGWRRLPGSDEDVCSQGCYQQEVDRLLTVTYPEPIAEPLVLSARHKAFNLNVKAS